MKCPSLPPLEQKHLNSLCAPLSSSHPTGQLNKHHITYDKIHMLRKTLSEESFSKGVWTQTQSDSQHLRPQLEKLCCSFLEHTCKDWKVAFSLVENWVYSANLNGLWKGLQLLHQLNKEFGTLVHPHITCTDSAEQVFSLCEWFDDNLSKALGSIHIVMSSVNQETITWSDYLKSQRYACDRSQNKKVTAAIAQREQIHDFPTIEKHILQTSVDFYTTLQKTLQQCTRLLEQLASFFDQHLQKYTSVPRLFSTTQKNIQKILDTTTGMKEKVLSKQPSKIEKISQKVANKLGFFNEQIASQETSKSIKTATKKEIKPLHNDDVRKKAYHDLNTIADILMESDPQSPVPALLKRIGGWEKKTYIDIITELAESPHEQSFLGAVLAPSVKNKKDS